LEPSRAGTVVDGCNAAIFRRIRIGRACECVDAVRHALSVRVDRTRWTDAVEHTLTTDANKAAIAHAIIKRRDAVLAVVGPGIHRADVVVDGTILRHAATIDHNLAVRTWSEVSDAIVALHLEAGLANAVPRAGDAQVLFSDLNLGLVVALVARFAPVGHTTS
jgi:hypothetical protein